MAINIEWFTSTIWGIILLGTVGSIIAAILIYILKPLVKWVLYRILDKIKESSKSFVIRIFLFFVPYIFIRKFTFLKLREEKDKSLSAAYYLDVHIASEVSFSLFIIFLTASLIFLSITGLTHPFLSAFLVGVTIFLFVCWVFDFIVMNIINNDSNIQNYENEIEETFKDNKNLFEAILKEFPDENEDSEGGLTETHDHQEESNKE